MFETNPHQDLGKSKCGDVNLLQLFQVDCSKSVSWMYQFKVKMFIISGFSRSKSRWEQPEQLCSTILVPTSWTLVREILLMLQKLFYNQGNCAFGCGSWYTYIQCGWCRLPAKATGAEGPLVHVNEEAR